MCLDLTFGSQMSCFTAVIIIIKRISRAPINHTMWQHRALYNNTNHTHTHTHAHTHAHARTCAHAHTHTVSDEGMGRAVKNSLEIVIKQVHLEGGFKRGGRIRVAECLRQIVYPGLQTSCSNTVVCMTKISQASFSEWDS